MITFHYSNIYDINLAKWLGYVWKTENEKSGKRYAGKIQNLWNAKEKIVKKSISKLSKLNLTLPTNITGYVVSNWYGMTAFSDPLTIPAYNNTKIALVKIIHELIHICFSFHENRLAKSQIYQHIGKKFNQESYATRIHIVVNLLQQSVMQDTPDLLPFLDKEKTVTERLYPGQKRAWEILMTKREIDISNPINSLLNF